jgi:hypothetical protein
VRTDADQSLVFGSDAERSRNPGMEEASRNLMAVFAAFARTGNPNHSGTPTRSWTDRYVPIASDDATLRALLTRAAG